MKFRTENNNSLETPNERQFRLEDMIFRTANNILFETSNERQ